MYIKVVFVKKLLDVDIIFNIENAIVDDMTIFILMECEKAILENENKGQWSALYV